MHKPAPSLMLKDPFIADLVERGWKEAIIMKSYLALSLSFPYRFEQ